MIDDSTNGIVSTKSRAGVNALLLRPACPSLSTVGVGDTFWPTAGVRVALREARKTLADSDGATIVVVTGFVNALSVWPAGRWEAWICRLRRRLTRWF